MLQRCALKMYGTDFAFCRDRYALAWGMEKAHALLGVDVPFHR